MSLNYVLVNGIYPTTGCLLTKYDLLSNETVTQFRYGSNASCTGINLVCVQVDLISNFGGQFRFQGDLYQTIAYLSYLLYYLSLFYATGVDQVLSKRYRLYGSGQVKAMKEYLTEQSRLIDNDGQVISLKGGLRSRIIYGYDRLQPIFSVQSGLSLCT